MSVLREIWRWREQEAIASNKPPFFILSPEIMVNLSYGAVAGQDLENLFPHYVTPRRRKGIAKAVETGLAERHPPMLPRRKSHRLSEAEKRRLQDIERRRNRHAEDLGIDPTLIASRASMVALAADKGDPDAELMPWQKELLK